MENINPNLNPKTTIPGYILIGISSIMLMIKYVLPAFLELKQEPAYPDWIPFGILGLGVIGLFLTDEIFLRIFNRGDKIVAKKTDTDKE